MATTGGLTITDTLATCPASSATEFEAGWLRQASFCRGQRGACPCLPIPKHHRLKGKHENTGGGRKDRNGKADA